MTSSFTTRRGDLKTALSQHEIDAGSGFFLNQEGLRTCYLSSLLHRPTNSSQVNSIPIPDSIAAYRTRDLLRSRAGRVLRGKGDQMTTDDGSVLAIARNVIESQLAARDANGDGSGSSATTTAAALTSLQRHHRPKVNVARIAATEAKKNESTISLAMEAWGRSRTAENLYADALTADRLTPQHTFAKGVALYSTGNAVKMHLHLQPPPPQNNTASTTIPSQPPQPSSSALIAGGGEIEVINSPIPITTTNSSLPFLSSSISLSQNQGPTTTTTSISASASDDDVIISSPTMPTPFKRLPVPVVIISTSTLPSNTSNNKTTTVPLRQRESLLAWWDSGVATVSSSSARVVSGGVGRKVREIGDTESPASRVISASSHFVQRFDTDAVRLAKAITMSAARYHVAQAQDVSPSSLQVDVPKWPTPPQLPSESIITNALRPGSAIHSTVSLPRNDLPARPSTAAAAAPPAKGSKEIAAPVPGVLLTNYVGGLLGDTTVARVNRLEALRARVFAAEIKRVAAEKKAAKAGGGGAKKK